MLTRRRRSRASRRGVILLAAALALAALGTVGKRAGLERAGSALARLERWGELAGLGLDQVALIGHRYTADRDIFEAIDLKRSRTLLTFDSQRAQARVLELPWIAEASIERIFPDRLEVRVSERTPVAVWTRGERSVLIDDGGRTLGPVAADGMPALPRVTGEGADRAAAGLISLLAASELKSQLAYAERVGERRWTLRLKEGGAIQLPAQDEAKALKKAAAVLALAVSAAEIDVRATGRAIVRDVPRPSQAQLTEPDGARRNRL